MKLYKTTIVIWTKFHPEETDIVDLAKEATIGNAYCSQQKTVRLEDASQDSDWDGTEFFNEK